MSRGIANDSLLSFSPLPDPNVTRALHNWFPLQERGVTEGAVWMAGRLMRGLTPLVWLIIVDKLGLSWRQAFWLVFSWHFRPSRATSSQFSDRAVAATFQG
jgi:hypothetical protein